MNQYNPLKRIQNAVSIIRMLELLSEALRSGISATAAIPWRGLGLSLKQSQLLLQEVRFELKDMGIVERPVERKISDAKDLMAILEHLVRGFAQGLAPADDIPWGGIRLTFANTKSVLSALHEELTHVLQSLHGSLGARATMKGEGFHGVIRERKPIVSERPSKAESRADSQTGVEIWET